MPVTILCTTAPMNGVRLDNEIFVSSVGGDIGQWRATMSADTI